MFAAGSAIIKMIHILPGQFRLPYARVNLAADIINAFPFAFRTEFVGYEPVTASFGHIISHAGNPILGLHGCNQFADTVPDDLDADREENECGQFGNRR